MLGVVIGLLVASPVAAAPGDWAEGTQANADGATRDYYNRGARLAWKTKLGDWTDRSGKVQGTDAYATARIVDDNKVKPVTFDVTALVREWASGKVPNKGLFIRVASGGGTWDFYGRERTDKTQRPQLSVVTSSGTVTLEPSADTYLDTSTFRSLGHLESLRLRIAMLIRFDLSTIDKGATVSQATLRLTTYRQYGSTATVAVFRCSQGHDEPASKPIAGIAAKYTDDAGIEKDPDVYMATGFEEANWKAKWTSAGGAYAVVSSDPARKLAPLLGKALSVHIKKGALLGLSLIYGLDKVLGKGKEPEEIFFRYYLRLGDDWRQTIQGGKMPGISGTYDTAGWGGRRSNGNNGWSARGLFIQTIPKGNPLAGRTPIGFYAYHADQATTFGDNWLWQRDYRGVLANNEWRAVEEYVKMNTPGKKDGILRAWIDGRPAFEKKDIRFRNVARLKVQRIWFNVYHGGTVASPHDQHLFIDNVVIAKRYIGPLSSRLSPSSGDAGPGPATDGGSTGPDATTTPASDAALADAGVTPQRDAGAGDTAERGCSCDTASPTTPAALPLLAVIALGWVRRRR